MLAEQVNEYVIRMRRYFHQYPELGFKEFKTQETIESELRGIGLSPKKMGGTGVVADIKGALPGKTVAVRADIDGLPIKEENDIEYASKNEGVMHACGHDAHIAMLLGLARLLVQNVQNMKGNVRLLFQPAEEAPPGGALSLIKEGALQGVDYIIGQHIDTTTQSGKVSVWYGPSMANADMFKVLLIGKGGHGSEPHDTVDAIVMGSYFVVQLQTIVSRKINPLIPAVVSVGTFKAGYRDNVIAPRAELTGTVRTLDDATKMKVKEEIKRILDGICSSFGGSYEFQWEDGYPVLINDKDVTKVIEDAAAEVIGRENVLHPTPKMGGEDFAYYTKVIPGAYYFLGARNESKGIISPHHSPTFNIDEDVLRLGVEILYRSTFKLLGQD